MKHKVIIRSLQLRTGFREVTMKNGGNRIRDAKRVGGKIIPELFS